MIRKFVLLALVAGFVAACGEEPAETAPQGQTNQQMQPAPGQPKQ